MEDKWADARTYVKTTPVQARRLDEDGTVQTERGPMAYKAGDWMLRTVEGTPQEWPVSDEYFKANYRADDAIGEATTSQGAKIEDFKKSVDERMGAPSAP